MMKKLFAIGICVLLSIWTVSADLSDSLFCLVRKDNVIISLKQTSWYYKCKDTIASLEKLIINTAKDLIKIQTYINKWRDVDYRKPMKIQKQALFTTLMASKNTITVNMQTFETNLLKKSVKYFILRVTPYKVSLQKSLVKIRKFTWDITPAISLYTQLLQAQITTIDSFKNVTTTAQLSDVLAKYVYLKNALLWKSE